MSNKKIKLVSKNEVTPTDSALTDTQYSIQIPREKLLGLVELCNDLRRTHNCIMECNDLWMSDVKNIDRTVHAIVDILDLEYDSESYDYVLKWQKD